MKKLLVLATLAPLLISYPVVAGEGHNHEEKKPVQEKVDNHDDHGEEGGHEEEEGAEVDLTPDSIKMAGIKISPLILQTLKEELSAPGEVTVNSYLSSKITPRIEAQIIARHAKMGDFVTKGQSLVTLSSVDMAEAIGELLVAHKEWKRVKQLGSAAVSAKRYSAAKIIDGQALAKVKAYGMTEEQIKMLHENGTVGNAGEFQLIAPRDGIVISDNFIEGELIEPGRVLFDIVDESTLWIESRLSPDRARNIEIGAAARINVDGDNWLSGKVVQKHHLLDRETRTIGVRIEVSNKEDYLHSGMYVDTKIESGAGAKHLAVPTKSVLRSSDGDWVVFVEANKGEFKPVEIEIGKVIGSYTTIKNLPAGTRIVTEGAFFVQSELAKSGFAVHNH